MKNLKLYYPCRPFKLNQGFGENKDYYKTLNIGLNEGHNGLDLYAPDSTLVRAAHDGIVTFTGHDGSGGLGIVIRTKEPMVYLDGSAYYKTIYWHLKEGTIRVKPDQEVVAGTIIALADNTGLSTGSHLHFGCKPMLQGEQPWQWNNIEQDNGFAGAIDPTIYFTGVYADVVYPGLPARAFQALLNLVKTGKI